MQFGNHIPTEVRNKSYSAGTQWKFAFDNGFGASVINDGYGGDRGLYELGVLGPDGHLTYETPITNDVLGYQTADGIAAALDQIAALNPEIIAQEKVRRLQVDIDDKREQIAKIERDIAELQSAVTA